MTTSTSSPTPEPPALSMVVGLDFTDADGPAFDQAVRIAQHVPHAALHLVHVFHEPLSAERSRDLVGHLRIYVDEKKAILPGLPGITVGIHLRSGNPVREIVQLSVEVRADLIVVGSHKGPHLKQWIVGSTSGKLVSSAPCPVLVASPKAKDVQHEPMIEPPCPQCVEARRASGGANWWCERHSHEANGAHTYSYQREFPFASHDSAIFPTGIDF